MSKSSSSPQTANAAQLVAVALNVEGGAAPEWVELIPAGHDVIGRDGRAWINPDPAAVVLASRAGGQPLPLDWEHATEVRAPKGEEAPAAAWIEELEVRENGSIWGRADWTPRGAAQVAGREYRFLSPVFAFDAATRAIKRLVSAALTNTPNLVLTALNREEGADITRELKETSLTLAQRLAAALGLSADTGDDAIVAAVTEARAANRPATPDLTNFAPRADLDAALNRAQTAETERDALRKEKTDAAIETAINGALDAGKIVPASAETYRAMCREDGGLERFTALVATLPVIAGAAESRAQNKVEKADGKSSLTDEERAVCRALGQSEDDFLKAKAAAQ